MDSIEAKLILFAVALLLILLWDVLSTKQEVKELKDLWSEFQLDGAKEKSSDYLPEQLQRAYDAGFNDGADSKGNSSSPDQV